MAEGALDHLKLVLVPQHGDDLEHRRCRSDYITSPLRKKPPCRVANEETRE